MNLIKSLINLIRICEQSNQKAIRLWSDSLKKNSSKAFYNLSKDTVMLSKKKSTSIF